MSQTDAMSTGGESGRGGHAGNTGTGCYKNHEHSMHIGASAGSCGGLGARSGAGLRRQSCGAAPGAVSIAAVTALLASSPATTGIVAQNNSQQSSTGGGGGAQATPSNNLVDLGTPSSRFDEKHECRVLRDHRFEYEGLTKRSI